MKRIACFAAVLLLVTYAPHANANHARALVFAGLCGLCLTGAGCGVEKTPDQRRLDGIKTLKAEKAKEKPGLESHQLALRQFALASGLVQGTVDGTNAATTTSDTFFVGVSFATSEKAAIASAAFYEALTSEERVHFELELDELTEFFVERFAQQPLRWADASYKDGAYTHSVKLPPVLVIFTKGQGSSTRRATQDEIDRVAKAFAAKATGVEVPKYQINVLTLDVRDLEDRHLVKRWRQLLSVAYPGEF